MNEGPAVRFMTDAVIMIGNVTLTFDVERNNNNNQAKYLAKLNEMLEPMRATASGDEYRLTLTLCDAERITITQQYVEPYRFLNIEYDMAGCHDELAGLLGQLYQCK